MISLIWSVLRTWPSRFASMSERKFTTGTWQRPRGTEMKIGYRKRLWVLGTNDGECWQFEDSCARQNRTGAISIFPMLKQVIAAAFLFSAANLLIADDWPQWLGPNRD